MSLKQLILILPLIIPILLSCFSTNNPDGPKYGPATPISSLSEITGTWVLVEVEGYTLGSTGSETGYSYYKANLNPPEEVLSISVDTLKRYDSIPNDTCYQYYFGLFDSASSRIDFFTEIADSLQYFNREIGLRSDTLQIEGSYSYTGFGAIEYYYLKYNTPIPTNICNY